MLHLVPPPDPPAVLANDFLAALRVPCTCIQYISASFDVICASSRAGTSAGASGLLTQALVRRVSSIARTLLKSPHGCYTFLASGLLLQAGIVC